MLFCMSHYSTGFSTAHAGMKCGGMCAALGLQCSSLVSMQQVLFKVDDFLYIPRVKVWQAVTMQHALMHAVQDMVF